MLHQVTVTTFEVPVGGFTRRTFPGASDNRGDNIAREILDLSLGLIESIHELCTHPIWPILLDQGSSPVYPQFYKMIA